MYKCLYHKITILKFLRGVSLSRKGTLLSLGKFPASDTNCTYFLVQSKKISYNGHSDATNKWYNEAELKLDYIISAIGMTSPPQPTSDFQLPASDFQLPTSNFQLPTF